MPKISTSELTGAALDWAVAKANGDVVRWSAPHEQLLVVGKAYAVYHPHLDWSQGGPIIEREFMDVEVTPCGADQGAPYDTWRAWKHNDNADAAVVCGPTPLIAAMRCYVASKLGDEVDVPEELT